ncbi:MAG: YbaY family lipoprotein [Verrucomicrobia bacterium]|nr:YbaY family lipoprotein [Verrucomicrobiota bacterium]
MKSSSFLFVAAFGLLLAGAGCEHLDLASTGSPDRVLNGTLNFPSALPAGTEVLVRLIDGAAKDSALMPAGTDLPLGDRAKPVAVDRVLGEQRQKLETGTTQPVPFKIEYRAEDSVLRRGLTVEARVSYGGKVRFRTLNAHVVTLASSPFRQEVWVQPVQ